MSLGEALDAELTCGRVGATAAGRTVEADMTDVDRLAVRVERLRVRVPNPAPVGEQAPRMAEALRVLPEDVVAVEVAPTLGGAVYRTTPGQVVGGEYYEVRTQGGEATVERVQREGRRPVSFDLTRDQLRRLVNGIGEALSEG